MRDFEKTGLPVGWVNARLGTIADKITKGATPTTYGYSFQKNGINFIKIQNVSEGSIHLASITDFISDDANQNQKKSILKPDDVLFSIAGTIGETAIIKSIHLPANTNQAFAIISGFKDCLLPKFLGFQLRSFVTQKTKGKARGGAMNNVSLEDLKELEIPLPPLPEQHRIVAKIEELLSELDKGIENLKTAREQLKVYRQALLKHAFEGKLTEKWREENKGFDVVGAWSQTRPGTIATDGTSVTSNVKGGRGTDRAPTKRRKDIPLLTAEELAELPELPQGWGWVKVASLASKITDGEHFRPSVKESGVYFLSAKDVRDNGVVFEDPLFIDEETASKARERCDPERNDILIVSRGATVGRMCIVETDEKFCLLGSVILIKVSDLAVSKFMLYGLKSPLINKKIVAVSGATAQQAIYLRDIQHVPMPLCSLPEQKEIAKILEEKLSIVDNFDQTVTTALQQSETLRQSVLKKAFSGQLVSQDPHDEPASVLLERIRVERGVQDKSSKQLKSVPIRHKRTN